MIPVRVICYIPWLTNITRLQASPIEEKRRTDLSFLSCPQTVGQKLHTVFNLYSKGCLQLLKY